MKTRLAIIGNGLQVREHHLPYICKERDDVELHWASGCTCTQSEIPNCPLRAIGLVDHCCPGVHIDDWKELLKRNRPDAVIISTPNATHLDIVRCALAAGVHVAVDKPATISSEDCRSLVGIAQEKNCVFLTISQRRYEDVFQAMKHRMVAGELGRMRLINYVTAHSFGPKGWRRKRSLAGGGILIDSAYHGIDIILWLLSYLPIANRIYPIRLSADWLLDGSECDPSEQVELIGAIRIVMSNGCLINVVASYENPKSSVDESIKIYGEEGALRYVRDKLKRIDMSAGRLTFQRQTGEIYIDHNGESQGKRWAPIKDFLDAIAAGSRSVISPAVESISVLRILEAAYKSAASGGLPVNLTETNLDTVLGIDHFAVQTNDIDKAIEFYVGILGAVLLERQIFKRRQMAWLKVGDTKIELFSKRAGENLETWSDLYSGPVHIAFRVANLDAFLSMVLAKGARFHPSHPTPFVPPVEGASKIAYLAGPDGEEVEIRNSCDN